LALISFKSSIIPFPYTPNPIRLPIPISSYPSLLGHILHPSHNSSSLAMICSVVIAFAPIIVGTTLSKSNKKHMLEINLDTFLLF
jgi:hypothetical protein